MIDRKEIKRLADLYKAFGLTLTCLGPGLAFLNPYIGVPLLLTGVVFLVTGIERSLHLAALSAREPERPPR